MLRDPVRAGGAQGSPSGGLAYPAGEEELVYPASFEYFAPATLDEALSILDEQGDDAKVMAGGQSLIPLMKLRFAAPEAIVDLNRIPGLDGARRGGRRAADRGARPPQGLRAVGAPARPLPRCSATRRRRSPTRSCATAARSAARSPTPTPRATGAR